MPDIPSLHMMSYTDPLLADACAEIARQLLTINGELTPARVRGEIMRVCSKYSLPRVPANHEILSAADRRVHGFDRLKKALIKKPAKTASGVAVVALMPKPYACPHGRCTYCPGGMSTNSPNSYTGKEPATIQAIEAQYDPVQQITSKLDRLEAFGHDTSKTELVIVGGTFLFMPIPYQEYFIKSCYDALNDAPSADLHEAQLINESARTRNVGFTIETKPDYCRQEHVDMMLRYGITRIEIGVQSLHDRVYKHVNRGHTYHDVIESFRVSKDSGYKIVAHMMPGLPTMTPRDDIADLQKLFIDEQLRPDMLKIYPSLVIRGTPLYNEYVDGRYMPYSDHDMITVLAEAKKSIPKWVRIMRIQREISSDEIVAGPKSGNLRQEVHREMQRQGTSCRCIKCREIGTSPVLSGRRLADMTKLRLERADYRSSGGDEVFLSYEDCNERIYGFLRLRKPSTDAHRPEVGRDSCIVRELHVYGPSLGVGVRGGAGDDGSVQHMGLGKRLLAEAERVCAEEFGVKRILVISAVGTRPYYHKLGYSLYGPYMHKDL